MQAIVYTSNTGFTKSYAHLLGEATTLPVYDVKQAARLPRGTDIIYMGWVMAGGVQGYAKTAKRLRVCAVCAVGMQPYDAQTASQIQQRLHAEDVPVFMLQGGYDKTKLGALHRFIMKGVSSMLIKQLSEKSEKTHDDENMLDLLQNGGSRVSKQNLAPVLHWLNAQSKDHQPHAHIQEDVI